MSVVQAAAVARVAIVKVARADTDVVSRETRRVHLVRVASIPSSAAVSVVVAAAHHLRLRKAEMVAGAPAAVLLRKWRRCWATGRTMRTKLHQLRPPLAVGSEAPCLPLSVSGGWTRRYASAT